MKKSRFSLGEGGIQGFAVRHVEKAVLGALVLLLGLFVYQGYKLEGLSDKDPVQAPDKLRDLVTQAKSKIDDANSWDRMKGTREYKMNVPQEVDNRFLRKTAPDPYRLALAWDRPLFPRLSPRTDPKLFAPEGLRVAFLEGPVSYQYFDGDEDSLDALDSPSGVSAPKKTTKKPKAKTTAPGSSAMTPPTSGGNKKKKGSADLSEMYPGGTSGFPESSRMAESPTMGSSGGMYGSGMGGQTVKGMEILGYRPSKEAIGKSVRAAVITAVVPFEKQYKAYLDALSGSQDFNPDRDTPYYLTFRVQRSDVTDDPTVADPAKLKWVNLKSPEDRLKYVQENLDGVPDEVLDPDYLDPKLTQPVWPFMMRDLTDVLTYPDIPRFAPLQTAITESARKKPKPGEEATEETEDDPLIGRDPMGESRNVSPAMGGSGTGRQRNKFGGHMKGSGGMGSGYPGMESRGSGGSRGGSAMYPMGSGGMGSGGMGAMTGSGAMAGTTGAEFAPPPYKLVRFTDETIKPNRIYRYRIRVYLEDPNHPEAPEISPAIETLEETVKERIKALEAKDEKSGNRSYFVTSDWSAPSEPVSLPKRDWFYASSVSPPTTLVIDSGKLPPIPVKEPTAKLLVRVWDEKHAVDVPVLATDLVRGSPLSFVKSADVVHPVTTELKQIRDYAFKTDGVVVDIVGGETIPAAIRGNDKPRTAPGEVLVVDGNGRLVVQSEVNDVDDFKRFHVDEETLAAANKTAGSAYPMSEAPPMPVPSKTPKGKPRPN